MNRSKEPGFADRQSAAATAKKAALEKHRAMLSDPGLAERQAARQAVATARESRAAERKTAQTASTTREAAEQAVKEAAEQAACETVLRVTVPPRRVSSWGPPAHSRAAIAGTAVRAYSRDGRFRQGCGPILEIG